MSTQYKVITTLRSPVSDPVDIVWYKGDSALQAMVVAGQILADNSNPEDDFCQLLKVSIVLEPN